jgi:hypothetical protein
MMSLYNIEVTTYDIVFVTIFHMCSGGSLHYNHHTSTYGLFCGDENLYDAEDTDPFINEMGLYVLDKLLSFRTTCHCRSTF